MFLGSVGCVQMLLLSVSHKDWIFVCMYKGGWQKGQTEIER